MRQWRIEGLTILRVALVACAIVLATGAAVPAQSVRPTISDTDFWAMVDRFSEPGGSFASDNIISNEIAFQQVIPELKRSAQHGAYLGVGPEQNFTYITALKPAIAFIIDIRRQNLLLHLMYKALAEMSADRVDFMSRLFARPAPVTLAADAGAGDLFDAFAAVSPSEDRARSTLAAIINQLAHVHRFP